ncbi:NAD(P)H-binding protein [Streptomyces sp. NPDC001902]
MVPPGEEVRVLVRDAERGEGPTRLGARIATGDLRGPEDLREALAGMDAVVHLAALFPDGSQEGTTPARAAAEAGATRFVQASTNLVYGEGRGRPLAQPLRRAPGVGGPAYNIADAAPVPAVGGAGLPAAVSVGADGPRRGRALTHPIRGRHGRRAANAARPAGTLCP